MAIALAFTVATPALPANGSHMLECGDMARIGFAAQQKVRSGGVRAVSGELEGQTLFTCTFDPGQDPPGRVTWEWVSIEGPCDGSGNCIMQIGIGRGKNTEDMGWWWAWGRSPKAPGCEGRNPIGPGAVRFATWNGQQSTFQVVFVPDLPGPGYWSFRINGVQKQTVSESKICWAKTTVDWFGETYSRESAIGGTLADQFVIAEARYRIPGDATWYGPGWVNGALCDIENPKPPYHCEKTDSDTLVNWTAR